MHARSPSPLISEDKMISHALDTCRRLQQVHDHEQPCQSIQIAMGQRQRSDIRLLSYPPCPFSLDNLGNEFMNYADANNSRHNASGYRSSKEGLYTRFAEIISFILLTFIVRSEMSEELAPTETNRLFLLEDIGRRLLAFNLPCHPDAWTHQEEQRHHTTVNTNQRVGVVKYHHQEGSKGKQTELCPHVS